MRPQHLIAATAAALLATACSAAPAAPVAAGSPTIASSTVAPAPSPSAASAGIDPACSDTNIDDVLYGVNRASDDGAFDIPPRAELKQDKVEFWHYLLREMEAEAGPKLAKASADARGMMAKWMAAEPGSEERDLYRMGIEISSGTLALVCRLHKKYPFASDGV
ncbi:hypothetical protein ACBI99_44570 [Nonomuraea sp. ATR24]|uniref:hypothetical protein n=1 Tax=Nonomuraea sp. ATR24 TaxID=1676744 RepID=UPI0035C0D43F